LLALLGIAAIAGLGAPIAAQVAQPPAPAERSVIWEVMLHDFSESDYAGAVEAILSEYETTSGRRLRPGDRGKVGLKIYSDSGPGLSTPPALVKGVIAALERRGYRDSDILLVGLNQLRLRLTGFLPSLSSGRSTFRDHPVFVLESGRFYASEWFYDSPLPTRFDPTVLQTSTVDPEVPDTESDRTSFLATPFLRAVGALPSSAPRQFCRTRARPTTEGEPDESNQTSSTDTRGRYVPRPKAEAGAAPQLFSVSQV
jgi:hypothetical protein